jgi:hypothetical protein
MVNTIPVRLICHPHMKVLLFSIFATVVLIGCAPADPIDRAVKAESSKPAPRGMAYLVTSAPATALPAEIATKVLSGPGWNESPTNVVILESRQVSISHKDDKELLTPAMKQWIAVLADTKFGKKIVFCSVMRITRIRGPSGHITFVIIDSAYLRCKFIGQALGKRLQFISARGTALPPPPAAPPPTRTSRCRTA